MPTKIVGVLIIFMMGCMFAQKVEESACTQKRGVCLENSKNIVVNVKDKCIYFLHVDMH